MRSIPSELEGVLSSTPDTLHGAIRFTGTRVFAYQVFDYVLSGSSLNEFLNDFPGVSRRQATKLLEWELNRLHADLEPAA